METPPDFFTAPGLPAPDWLKELGWEDTYELRRLIGRGGMGRVHEAWHRTLRIPVALKVIDPALAAEDNVRARFEKEALTLARLQDPVPHPNIVRVLDFKLLRHVGCIVMAFIRGVDLKTWCARGHLDIREKTTLLAKVARAAGYIHSRGVVHRDLKPANILVREESGEPVIVDFGIVRAHEDVTLTRTQHTLGTAAYMAPEMMGVQRAAQRGRRQTSDHRQTADPQARVDDTASGFTSPRADVYSLGVVLYELLTGTLPHGTTLAEVLPRHEQEVVPRPITAQARHLPRDLETVCLKAIASRPEERYATGMELAEDLERFLRGEPVEARPLPKIVKLMRKTRQRPALTAAVAACAAIGVFATAEIWKHTHDLQLAKLRADINASLRPETLTAQTLQETDRQIDQLVLHDPDQAASFRKSLVKGASREVQSLLKEPRLRVGVADELLPVLAWIRRHDEAESARLMRMLQERHTRWGTMLEIKLPFDRISTALSLEHLRVESDGIVFTGADAGSHRLSLTRPSPLEIQASFLMPDDFAVLGFKALLFDEWFSFQLVRPVPRSVREHLQNLRPPPAMAGAALFISRPDTVLAAAGLDKLPAPGERLALRLRINGGRLLFELDDGPRVQHSLRYNFTQPVAVSLTGSPGVKLHELTWTGPVELPRPSTLEKGDALAGARRWKEAEVQFLSLAGDPACGTEALFKAGDCQMHQDRPDDAQRTWENVMLGPPSPWRTEACLQLWFLHAEAGRLPRARGYLDQLPGPADMPPGCLDEIKNWRNRRLDDLYHAEARGLKLLRPMPGVEDAIRVHRMLDYTPHELCARYALARHCNGTDESARDLLLQATAGRQPDHMTEDDFHTLNTNLEIWSLMARSEADPALAEAQARWLGLVPPGHSVAMTIRLDQARRLARENRTEQAVEIAREVLAAESSTIMAFTGAALLLSTLHADPGDAAVRHALDRVAKTRRQVHELTLIHRLLLHSVLGNWTQHSAADILGQLMSLGESGNNRENLNGRLNRFLISDESMVAALNQLLDGPRGAALLHKSALRDVPVRDCIRDLFFTLLRRHLVHSVFGTSPNDAQTDAANQVTTLWLRSFSMEQITTNDFLILLQHLGSPPTRPVLKKALQRWPDPLRKAVQALHQSRTSS